MTWVAGGATGEAAGESLGEDGGMTRIAGVITGATSLFAGSPAARLAMFLRKSLTPMPSG